MTLTNIEIVQIPYNELFLSTSNVRQSMEGDEEGKASIEDLAASIEASGGLLQNIVVVPEAVDGRSGFGVVAGGRRWRAVGLLVKAGKVPADYPMPCRVTDADAAMVVSLMENTDREEMHPVDEFKAFAGLVEQGKAIDTIAAIFRVTPAVVTRRLALAKVSPTVLAAYRAGKLEMSHVTALTLTDDHATQERLVLAGSYVPHASEIRRHLMAAGVSGASLLGRFVGQKAYTKAGGQLRSDLFSDKGEVFFLDRPLLERLALEKLEKHGEKIAHEHAWIECVAADWDWSMNQSFRQVPNTLAQGDEGTEAKLASLRADLVVAEKAFEDCEDDELWDDLGEKVREVEAAIEEIEDQLTIPDPAYTAVSGAVLCIGSNGKVDVRAGRVRAEDWKRLNKPQDDDEGDGEYHTSATRSPASASIEPASVKTDLTGYLTGICQLALTREVGTALRALAYSLALNVVEGWDSHGICIRLTDNSKWESEVLDASPVAADLKAVHEQWQATLPTDDGELWAWIKRADDSVILELLAYCTARSLNGITSGNSPSRVFPLVDALGVDLRDYWTPNAAYFGKLKKADTLRALEQAGKASPQLAKAKRGDLAVSAAQLLQGTGWLPPSLRAGADEAESAND